jgi:hypothetical protein
MANSSRHSIYYDAESTYGTTEASPGFSAIRHTGVTLGTQKSGIISEELRSDRGITDLRHGNKNVTGDVSTELSYGAHDDLFEAGQGGTWETSAVTITASTISATASGNTVDDSGSGFGSFAAGDMVKISGFSGATTNNGIARVTAASASSLTLDGLTLIDDAAGESVTITVMDFLRTGTTRRSFSVIRDFSELTDGRYQLHTGSEVNTIALSAGLDAIVTTSFGFIAKGQTSSSSAPGGSTFGAPGTTEPFVSFDGCLSEGGAESAIVTAFDVTLDNGLEPKFNLCSDEQAQPGIGRANVTGNITAYFDNDTLLNKFLNETESNLLISVTDAAGNTFGVYAPKVKYTGGQPDISNEANSTLSMPYQALQDVTVSGKEATLIFFKLDA